MLNRNSKKYSQVCLTNLFHDYKISDLNAAAFNLHRAWNTKEFKVDAKFIISEHLEYDTHLKRTNVSRVFFGKSNFKKMNVFLGWTVVLHASPVTPANLDKAIFLFFASLKECRGSRVPSFSPVSFGNEQAKLFGRDHRPLTPAVTSGLCICKTLKHINIAMH